MNHANRVKFGVKNLKSEFLAGCIYRYAPEWSKTFSYDTTKNPGFVELIYFVVHPNLSKKGLGTALMNKLVETVKANEKIRVTKIVTFADNLAINFFKKQQFKKMSQMQKFSFKDKIEVYQRAT